ncbi:MAG: oligosaccharide flippase family protein [Solobacterium sp.]|nr:oligosaccharide flippase family protein [Solobacterium sp.]
MSNESRQLKYGALISYLAILVNTVMSLIYLPWMARTIGKSNYALYQLAYSFVQIFLADFGLSSAAARFLAKYRAENREEQSNILIAVLTKLYIGIDLIIALIMFVIYSRIDVIYRGLTVSEIAAFRPLFLIMAGYSILSFPFMSLNGILTAYEKFIQLKLCDFGQKVLTVLLVVYALLSGRGVVAVMAANAASGLFFILLKLYIIRKQTPVRPDIRTHDDTVLSSVLQFSIWTAVVALAQRFIFSLAPTILGIVSNSSEIALFAPANALEGYFYMFAAAVNGLFLARISRYIADNREDRIYTLMVNVGRYQLAVMGLIFIGFLCIGRDFMIQWMGADYEGAAVCAALIFIPDLLLFTQQIANETVIAKNEVRHNAFSNIGMAVVCVVLSFPLSTRFGAMGACLAIAVSYMFTFIYMNVIYYKKLHINVFRFFKECYTSFLLPYGLSYVLCRLITGRIMITGWKGIAVKILAVVIVYGILVSCLALKKSEREWISRKLRRNQE